MARRSRALCALLLALLLYPITVLWADEPGFVQRVVHRDVNKHLVKTDLELLRKLYGLVSNDPVLARKVTEEIGDAIAVLDGNAQAMAHFVDDLRQINSKAELAKLAENHKLRAHATSMLESRAADLAGKGDDALRKLIGLGDDGADQAGKEALRLLRQAEDEIAARGALSSGLDQKLTAAVRKLPPARARAARQLVRNQLAAKGTSAFGIFLRTGVDGIFVLTDAYAISQMEDAYEAGASASGAAVGYGLDVVGNVAVRALGGAGFLPGLLVSLSSAKVAELVTEIVLLQRDLENARFKEQWAATELRMDAIRGMLRVDTLIKAGELDKAQALLVKVKHFYFKRPLLASDGDDLYAKMLHLETVADSAARLIRANEIIARARVPYTQGYQLASQGRRLKQARVYVDEAREILAGSLRSYPELQPAHARARGLLAALDKLLAHPPPLRKTTIIGPERVLAGEVETFQVTVEGGIPDFHPTNMNGLALTTGVLVYWEAPSQPGPATLSIRLRDDSGQTIEASKRLQVAANDAPPTASAASDLRLRAYYIRPGYRQDGRIVEPQEVEAHKVHVYDDVHFVANLDDPGLQFRWSVNGKPDLDPNWKHRFWFRPEQSGVYTVAIEVRDTKGKSLGTAQWVFKAEDLDMNFVDPRGALMPEGD